eukprot:4231308-Amphidinium_carterae.1
MPSTQRIRGLLHSCLCIFFVENHHILPKSCGCNPPSTSQQENRIQTGRAGSEPRSNGDGWAVLALTRTHQLWGAAIELTIRCKSPDTWSAKLMSRTDASKVGLKTTNDSHVDL